MGEDDAGLEEGGGEPDELTIDVLEASQRHAFVGDAVLATDDRDVVAGGMAKVVQGPEGVLRLHGEDDDIAGPKGDLGGRTNGGHRLAQFAVGCAQEEAVALHGLKVGAAGDEHRLVPLFDKPGANDAPDRAGAIDDEPQIRFPRRGFLNVSCRLAGPPSRWRDDGRVS